jgi:hypothetical protein
MSRWFRLVLSLFLTTITVGVTASPVADPVSTAVLVGEEWLGPRPAAGAAGVRRPIYQGGGAMIVEQQEAQRVIRGWWPAPVADARASAIIEGFAWYLAAHAIERVYDLRYLRSAHSVESRAYLGDHIVWSFPSLRLSRSAVIGRDRYAAVFMALERWLGTPALQGAMFQVAHLPDDRLTADTIVTTISDAAGQDLSWLFDAAEGEVSYAVSALTTTSVTVARKGTGLFTGRSAARIGDFQSGDAVRLEVVFANGERTLVTWDGRDQSRTFQFEGSSPVTAASLDPERIITLDRNRLDNAIVPAQPTNVPARKWAARWLVWLQHTMLSYGFLA